MIGKDIHEEVLRECLMARVEAGPDWCLSIRVGGSGARWVPVGSRRESRRTWASLTAVGRSLKGWA